MVTALIVIGVVVFLAVDAYVLYRVLASRRSADDYGSLGVPGELALTLPAGGSLRLTYQESYTAPSTEADGIEFGVPEALRVRLLAPSGAELELKRPGFRGMGHSLSTGRGWSRAVIGTAQIAEAGVYTVSAGPELEDAVEPQVLAGK